MPALCFSSPEGSLCLVTLAEANLPESIKAQIQQKNDAWFKVSGLSLDAQNSDIEVLDGQALFFEWQRLEWLYEPAKTIAAQPPFLFYVNDVLEPAVKCRKLHGSYRLNGSINLGNAVGRTRFSIRDSQGKQVFELGAEVFPQKLDYKEDFPAMLEEITSEIYSLAFDVFKKTYASTKVRTTYHQTLSEWLNLYKVLATSFEQSIDTILRAPKSELKREMRLKSIDRVKRATHKSILTAIKNPSRHCRGGGLTLKSGQQISHLHEQHRKVSYDTHENRFVVWAIKDVIQSLSLLTAEISKRESNGRNHKPENQPLRLNAEIELLKEHQRQLRYRLLDPSFAEVEEFNNQQPFSTTLTMAPGYKEFYHRYLLLRKGLTLSDNELFSMDYKDIANLYEYWCFLKTVKLLRENPKYDLASSDIIKIEHQRFSVNLKKGKQSAVHFKQRSTGDEISLYYNRGFSSKNYTHTFDQVPDNFIEFSRSGYKGSEDKKTFKVVLDAKYRFDRGSPEYPTANTPYGPPLDTIAQLHRYRDAILWEQDSNDSVKVANKSIGGVILFPYPNDETDFQDHPFYKSIERVNIGAIPLQPGKDRQNKLYQDYLDSLFEQSGETLNEQRIQFDSRQYDTKRQSQRDLVMVGLVPSKNREARLAYHNNKRCFYTQWHKDPTFPLEKVKVIALYDQQTKEISAWAEVTSIEFLLGSELRGTGTTWPARKPNGKHCVYNLGTMNSVNLYAGSQMQGNRTGRFFISRLGLNLAIEHQDPNLLYIHSWEKYQEWKTLSTQYESIKITRRTQIDQYGNDASDISIAPIVIQE